MLLVELRTADGLLGRGESWVNFPAWAVSERLATLREGVLPLVVGTDSRAVTALHRRLTELLVPIGRQWGAMGPIVQAISAVDIAMWDLVGQRSGRAVGGIGGGRVRDRIGVYASSLGPEDVRTQAEQCRAAGFSAAKVRLGFGTATDTANLETARSALGDGFTLYADANQGWSLDEAIGFGPLLRDVDVEWVEEPVRGDRLTDLERFSGHTGVPVATGENLYRAEAFWDYAASPAVHVLQPDVSKTGGLTEARAICALATVRGKQVIPHLYGGAVSYAASLQLAASCPAVSAVEYDIRDNPLRDPLIVDPPRPLHGMLALPDGPGLGLVFDDEAFTAARDL
jgi:L-alanine-DL-glutamate epimerase-like enolase superfamily enzyme